MNCTLWSIVQCKFLDLHLYKDSKPTLSHSFFFLLFSAWKDSLNVNILSLKWNFSKSMCTFQKWVACNDPLLNDLNHCMSLTANVVIKIRSTNLYWLSNPGCKGHISCGRVTKMPLALLEKLYSDIHGFVWVLMYMGLSNCDDSHTWPILHCLPTLNRCWEIVQLWPTISYTPWQRGNCHHSMFHNPTAAVNLFHVGKQYLTLCKAEAAVTLNLIGRKIISNVKHADARNSLPILDVIRSSHKRHSA